MAWTCQRQEAGVVCKHRNDNRYQKCQSCGRRKPKRKRPEHRKALDLPYEVYIELNGGEFCALCGAPPKNIKLNRDHDHNHGGRPRGLLCPTCNRALPRWMTPEWLRRAADYIERSRSPA